MIRRQKLSHDIRNFHEHTPQKKRTYFAAPNYFNPSIYHGNHSTQPSREHSRDGWLYPRHLRPRSGADKLDAQQSAWIGRQLIYYGNMHDRKQLGVETLPEETIAMYARPNDYRILFLGNSTDESPVAGINMPGVRSKPHYDYRPGRMNIFVDGNDIIRSIAYF